MPVAKVNNTRVLRKKEGFAKYPDEAASSTVAAITAAVSKSAMKNLNNLLAIYGLVYLVDGTCKSGEAQA